MSDLLASSLKMGKSAKEASAYTQRKHGSKGK